MSATRLMCLVAAIGLTPSGTAAVIDERWLQLLWSDVLNRAPTAPEVSAQLSAISGGATRAQVASSVLDSSEYRGLLVESLYDNLLNRAADPASLSFFVPLLATNSPDRVTAFIAGSAEYYVNAGGTNPGFIAALFPDLLGRSATPGEVMFWVDNIAALGGREEVALAIVQSLEADTRLVNSYYNRFLRRPADPPGTSLFTGALQSGARDEQVAAQLLSSNEYVQLAQAVPEPATTALIAAGVLVFAAGRRLRTGNGGV